MSKTPRAKAKGASAAGAARKSRAGRKPADHLVEEEAVVRLLAEEISVDRRRVETGRLRIRRITRERLETVDEPLQLDEAEVSRVPVGTFVDTRPSIRETEDEIVIPVVEEVIVVERRLMLREEIHVRKTRRIEHHREEVRLRAQEVEIQRLPPKTSPTAK